MRSGGGAFIDGRRRSGRRRGRGQVGGLVALLIDGLRYGADTSRPRS